MVIRVEFRNRKNKKTNLIFIKGDEEFRITVGRKIIIDKINKIIITTQ